MLVGTVEILDKHGKVIHVIDVTKVGEFRVRFTPSNRWTLKTYLEEDNQKLSCAVFPIEAERVNDNMLVILDREFEPFPKDCSRLEKKKHVASLEFVDHVFKFHKEQIELIKKWIKGKVDWTGMLCFEVYFEKGHEAIAEKFAFFYYAENKILKSDFGQKVFDVCDRESLTAAVALKKLVEAKWEKQRKESAKVADLLLKESAEEDKKVKSKGKKKKRKRKRKNKRKPKPQVKDSIVKFVHVETSQENRSEEISRTQNMYPKVDIHRSLTKKEVVEKQVKVVNTPVVEKKEKTVEIVLEKPVKTTPVVLDQVKEDPVETKSVETKPVKSLPEETEESSDSTMEDQNEFITISKLKYKVLVEKINSIDFIRKEISEVKEMIKESTESSKKLYGMITTVLLSINNRFSRLENKIDLVDDA